MCGLFYASGVMPRTIIERRNACIAQVETTKNEEEKKQ
jgi:hypothetical protein